MSVMTANPSVKPDNGLRPGAAEDVDMARVTTGRNLP